MPITTFTAYSITDGSPLGGLTPSVTAERRNADGSRTVLSPRTAAPMALPGNYEISFTDAEVPDGTFVRFIADLGVDGEGLPLATTRYEAGVVAGECSSPCVVVNVGKTC